MGRLIIHAALVSALLVPSLGLAQSSEGNAALLNAARRGDVDAVNHVLDTGADIEAADPDGATALFWAAYEGAADVVRLLTEAGARLNPEGAIWTSVERTKAYGSPLAAAAGQGHAEVVAALAEAGAVLEQPEWDPETRNRTGWTAAQWAASEGHADVVGALMEAGGRPLWRWHGPEGQSPYRLADANSRASTAALFAALEGEWSALQLLAAGEVSLPVNLRSAVLKALSVAGLEWVHAALSGQESDTLRAVVQADSLTEAVYRLYGEARYVEATRLGVEVMEIHEAALGQDHPDTATSLNNLAILLYVQGDLAAARPLHERSLDVRERILGPDHPDTAASLNNLAALLQAQGDLAGARPFLERALDVRERVLGPDHPDTAQSLNNLAALLGAQGDLLGARPLYERALDIRERVLGPEHPETAAGLNNLASNLQAQGDFAGARPLHERSLDIRERISGPDHPDTAVGLNNLASNLQAQGDFADARLLYERALDIRERVLGSDHPDTAQGLNNLALNLQAQGDLAGARPLYERALDIRERVLGPEHPETAAGLNNLASNLQAQGDFASARPLYERALDIRERILGPDHYDTANSLNNLAGLLDAQGDLSTALPLYERALDIIESAMGADHPVAAMVLNNLAAILHAQGDLVAARPLYERALGINERVRGADHPQTATSLHNLASVLVDQDELAAARPLYERALDINERVLGSDHPQTATSLNNLALLLQAQDDFTGARPLYERALGIRERAFGPDHPDTAESLNNLAFLFHAQGDFSAARPLLERAGKVLNQFSLSVIAALAAPEQQRFVRKYLETQQSVLITTTTWPGTTRGDAERTYASLAGWKGLLLRGLRRQATLFRLASTHPDDTVRELTREVVRLGVLVERAYNQGQRVDSLLASQEGVWRQLVVALPDAAGLLDPWDAAEQNIGQSEAGGLSALRESLGTGGVFVDVYRYVRFPGPGENRTTRYVAVIVQGGADASPVQYVDLGLAEGVEGLLADWRRAVVAGQSAQPETENLHDAIWGPIYAALPAGADRVWVGPDGPLARLPWNWLANTDEDSERLTVSHVPSARALLRTLIGSPDVKQDGPLVAVGGIVYGTAGDDPRFKSLPFSGPEADAVAALAEAAGLRSETLTATAPTVTALRDRLPGVRYVHLATHGYFGRPVAADTVRRSVAGRNPLVESGIALAGANDSTEGLLTAENLATFDLRGTRLVVLSACETGLGQEVSGQGVLGLRAAVLAAGAESTLVALWDVPDDITAALMERFYRGLWQERLSPAAALRAAQEELRAMDLPPALWATWVLDGGR